MVSALSVVTLETDDERVTRIREIKVKDGVLEEQSFDLVEELLAKRDTFYAPVQSIANKFCNDGSVRGNAVSS